MPIGIYKRKPFSEEHKRNLARRQKGRRYTEEAKRKMSEVRKGIKLSEETKKKISEAKKGSIPWNKGKKTDLAPWLGKKRPEISGERNCNWKGGTSREYKEAYYSAEHKRWRMRVFERDNWTCQFCGIRGVYLTAHHIKSWARFPELRFDVNNGVTLCEDCHKLTDNYKGRQRKSMT